MPDALLIGVSEELFWTLNPNRLKPYVIANERREENRAKEIDMLCWLMGRYNHEAFSVTLANSFGKKKDAKYANMPYSMKSEGEKEDRFDGMSESEKIVEVKNIFMQLTSVESKFKMGGE